jgi:sulfite reductase beta subunit-like hemoprotein
VCVGDASHGIGNTRTGGDERNTYLPREFSVGVGHVNSRTLIAYINDLDPLSV